MTIKADVPTRKLSDYAYYRTGGLCQYLYEPESTEALAAIVKDLHANQTPYFVLGGGTNSLVWDEFYPGAVILFSKMKRIRQDGDELICEAGAENTAIAKKALAASLGGISWMNRLPGQIGATVRMNARCYGGEISEVASSVLAVLPDGTIHRYSAADGIFKGYKDMLFMDNGAIVAEVRLSLKPGDALAIKEHMDYCENDRIKKGQFNYPTCGCVFKNSRQVGVPSGMLLENAKAQDLNRPLVALNAMHSNFVYNKGASSQEILDFTFAMQERVWQEYGVWMEFEMEVLGQLTPELEKRLREVRPPQMQGDRIAQLRDRFAKNNQRLRPET